MSPAKAGGYSKKTFVRRTAVRLYKKPLSLCYFEPLSLTWNLPENRTSFFEELATLL